MPSATSNGIRCQLLTPSGNVARDTRLRWSAAQPLSLSLKKKTDKPDAPLFAPNFMHQILLFIGCICKRS